MRPRWLCLVGSSSVLAVKVGQVMVRRGLLRSVGVRQLRLVEVRFGLSGRCAVRAARFGKAVKASCV